MEKQSHVVKFIAMRKSKKFLKHWGMRHWKTKHWGRRENVSQFCQKKSKLKMKLKAKTKINGYTMSWRAKNQDKHNVVISE